jgi:hypothetical protein
MKTIHLIVCLTLLNVALGSISPDKLHPQVSPIVATSIPIAKSALTASIAKL